MTTETDRDQAWAKQLPTWMTQLDRRRAFTPDEMHQFNVGYGDGFENQPYREDEPDPYMAGFYSGLRDAGIELVQS